MQAIFYYLSLPFIFLFSSLPQQVLYVISDIVFYLNFYVIKYRRKVVQNNLKNSYPTKSQTELNTIEKDFFRILTDYFLETLKSFTISKASILKKGQLIENKEMNELAAEGKNIIISVGHVGNQEYVNLFMAANPEFPFTVKGAYHQLQNPYYEKLFHDSRQKFGSELYTMRQSITAISNQKSNNPFAFVLVNDQSAPPKKSYWTNFLNQETCFYRGTAIFAKKYDMPVFFMNISRPKRGQFILSFHKITTNPTEISEAEILEKHVNLLENNINSDPKIWLWSHKRWKHKRPV